MIRGTCVCTVHQVTRLYTQHIPAPTMRPALMSLAAAAVRPRIRFLVSGRLDCHNVRRCASTLTIPVSSVKQLRDITGAPMMECKNALVAEGGDVDRAAAWLKERGLAIAGKKSSRDASQGVIAVKVSASGDTAAIVEFNSETDFVARNAQFQGLARSVVSTALAFLPAARGSVSCETGLQAAAGAELDALSLAPLVDDAGAASGSPPLLGAAVKGLIAVIRENMVLRRAAAVAAPGGVVASYVHNAVAPGMGAIGVLVAIEPLPGREPIAAGSPAAIASAELGRRIAMHVAASKPVFLSRDTAPASTFATERAELEAQAAAVAKTPAIATKMVEGRLAKLYAERILLDQPFALADDGSSIASLVKSANKDARLANSPVHITGFVRFVLGDAAPATEANAA